MENHDNPYPRDMEPFSPISQYNVYCDESTVNSKEDNIMVIGGVMCPTQDKQRLVNEIKSLRSCYGIRGEFGWKTVCPSAIGFFKSLIYLFCQEESLKFRCVVVDRDKTKFSDSEERFQKIYYQVFNNWLDRRNRYRIFIDRRVDRVDRVPVLRSCLIGTRAFGASVQFVEEVESNEVELIQLADLFIGAIGYARNKRDKLPESSEAKKALCRDIELKMKIYDLSSYETGPYEEKFNIFYFRGFRNM